jgi:hypothetical protein
MDFAETIAVFVARVLAASVADGLVPVAPALQPGIDVVLVGVNESALDDAGLDEWSDRHLPDVGQHPDHHLAATLQQAQVRRLFPPKISY